MEAPQLIEGFDGAGLWIDLTVDLFVHPRIAARFRPLLAPGQGTLEVNQ
jgi:hypothetical protein